MQKFVIPRLTLLAQDNKIDRLCVFFSLSHKKCKGEIPLSLAIIVLRCHQLGAVGQENTVYLGRVNGRFYFEISNTRLAHTLL